MDTFMTVKQAAELLKIHIRTLYKNREIPRIKIGLILISIQVLITGQIHFIFTHNNCGILSVDNYFFLKGAIHIR